MAGAFRTPSFRGWHAVVLHRSHSDRDNLCRQMERLGLTVECVWPELKPEHANANVLVFDGDMGHEAQFPWKADIQPMPMIALLGTEAPGRVEWAIRRGAGAHLNKPIGSSGVYGALVVAQRSFDERLAYEERISVLEHRLSRRPQVVEAILALMEQKNCDARTAYRDLRELAMAGRLSIEDAADELNARMGGARGNRREA
ncbi:ANTAR domain-containing response regulator [Roseibium aggregatum]|uniref:ANTAR domain-containing protein n=1 Tax=Roseibium aggregatum TaxID=187304 RepID=A0A926P2F5_9HYPH|nr:ANTAR domain-containing protein [Roseibium aggregatum]MBD1548300.1 ANTAR domain-containing protein [Roseibium aggregatum]